MYQIKVRLDETENFITKDWTYEPFSGVITILANGGVGISCHPVDPNLNKDGLLSYLRKCYEEKDYEFEVASNEIKVNGVGPNFKVAVTYLYYPETGYIKGSNGIWRQAGKDLDKSSIITWFNNNHECFDWKFQIAPPDCVGSITPGRPIPACLNCKICFPWEGRPKFCPECGMDVVHRPTGWLNLPNEPDRPATTENIILDAGEAAKKYSAYGHQALFSNTAVGEMAAAAANTLRPNIISRLIDAGRPGIVLHEFSKTNRYRSSQFKNAQGRPANCNENWSWSDWLVALQGEVGELCNFVKKFNRGDFSSDVSQLEYKYAKQQQDEDLAKFRQHCADEMADVLIYLDLTATAMGIDLEEALISKFNEVSKKQGINLFIGPVNAFTGEEE